MKLLNVGEFILRKWVPNDTEFLGEIPVEYNEIGLSDLELDEPVAILRLSWNPVADDFRFDTLEYEPTKRLMTQ